MGDSNANQPVVRIAQARPMSGNQLTIMVRLCCSRKDEGKVVGDLSPHRLLRAMIHSNGMSLAETAT